MISPFIKVMESMKNYHLYVWPPRHQNGFVKRKRTVSNLQPSLVKTGITARQHDSARAWRTLAYLAVFVPYLFILTSSWIFPEFKWQETPDWRPILALAEGALKEGDLYSARSLYSRTARVASWREDWVGLLAAACGIKRLDSRRDAYSSLHTILLRAMIAAESKRDQTGLSAIATAFKSIGEHRAASMVLSRIQQSWATRSDDPVADTAAQGCWSS